MYTRLKPSSALYIHIPWCIKKCPYCDFNSHKAPSTLPEENYVQMLVKDFKQDLLLFKAQEISSIFIGGGTPSLFSAKAYEELLSAIEQLVSFVPNIEITLEANPGTVEQKRFHEYRQIGINRLSLGIQSFNPLHLQALGRIHDDKQAHQAITVARQAGFENINIDIMHGLPQQTLAEGLADLTTALSYEPEHISWYQLTIEPNTLFYKRPPTLPKEKICLELEQQGFEKLAASNFENYEVSAFCKPDRFSRHNLNYWTFGDYYGIGAGAHGKVTTLKTTYRTKKYRQPGDYLNPDKFFLSEKTTLSQKDLIFEFMLNTARLRQPIPFQLFEERTGIASTILKTHLTQAHEKKFIRLKEDYWQVTDLGQRYINDLLLLFL